ncbi:MAG: putative Fe-S cluster protein YjdI [Marivirga sp.]|jgi:uncharacterized Fe-S cluster protein YjdI
MKDIKKTYTNGEVTVVWQPKVCIHSEKCFRGLPDVFDPTRKPWIEVEAASTKVITEQIDKCPSGALSYYMNNGSTEEVQPIETDSVVETIQNGPLMVYGNIIVKEHQGIETKKSKVTAFCRCGASANKPFCDGTHKKVGFEG